MSDAAHYLSWRERQLGPFSLEEIKAQLHSGEVSGLHLIHHEGAWIPLEEFLAAKKARSPNPATAMRAPAPQADAAMERRIADLEAELQRRGPAAPVMPPQYFTSAPPPVQQWPQPTEVRRISAMAVVAFIGSLTSTLFLFLWPVAATVWLLSIIFGHASVSECQRNPALSGRGLAIAALAISYLTLLLFAAWVLFLRSHLL